MTPEDDQTVTGAAPPRARGHAAEEQGTGNREQGTDQGVANSPSTPPSSTSTPDAASVDGWSLEQVLLAVADYVEGFGEALDVPVHLRWLADGRTDLPALLGLPARGVGL